MIDFKNIAEIYYDTAIQMTIKNIEQQQENQMELIFHDGTNVPKVVLDINKWPHKKGCPVCGADAYVGLYSVSCSNEGCQNA